MEQDTEAYAVTSNLSSLSICIMSIYRSPTGNFLHTLDSILNFFTQQHN